MKTYTLTLKNGRRLITSGSNRLEAFDNLELAYYTAVQGYTYRDLKEV